MAERMIIEDEHDTGPKTSIKMTRALGEDIGWIALEIMEAIENESIDLKYSRWQWFISHFWDDEIWKMALNKVIVQAKNDKLNLNKNNFFLNFIFEKIATELNNAMKKGVHPIFRQAFMELVTKQKPKPEKPHQAKDLWD